MLKINIEKVIVTLGTLIFYMVFPFIWWWIILDKIPLNERDTLHKKELKNA